MVRWQQCCAVILTGALLFGTAATVDAAGVKGSPGARSRTESTRVVKGVPVKKPAKVKMGRYETPTSPRAEAKDKRGDLRQVLPITENEPVVLVGLMRNAHSPKVSINGAYTVYNGTQKWKTFSKGDTLRIGVSAKSITLDGKKVGETVYIRPEGFALVAVDGNEYRGALKLIRTPGHDGVTVINEVGMEEYLYGVVPREMSASWEPNALRAQAVAARTYALNHKNNYASQGFDVYDTIVSQVYGGVAAEAPESTQAVNDTAGEVILYKGEPIDAVFCAHSGGYTEDSENVWDNFVPYLRAVSEPLNDFTKQRWEKEISLADLESALAAYGKDVGKIKNIKLSKLKKAPVKAFDRTVSGRVRTLQIAGKKQAVAISGNRFQQMFDLRSTMFDIVKGSKNDRLKIIGYGYGHGVGMSQWGAQIMAQQKPRDPHHYRNILRHFYTGVTIEKMY